MSSTAGLPSCLLTPEPSLSTTTFCLSLAQSLSACHPALLLGKSGLERHFSSRLSPREKVLEALLSSPHRLLSWHLNPILPGQPPAALHSSCSACPPRCADSAHVSCLLATFRTVLPLCFCMGCALLPQGSFQWVLQVLVPSSLCARADHDVRAPIAAQREEAVRGSQKREQGLWRQVCDLRTSHYLSEPLFRQENPS